MQQYKLENGTITCIFSYEEGIYEALATWAMLDRADIEIDEQEQEIRVHQRDDDEFYDKLKGLINILK